MKIKAAIAVLVLVVGFFVAWTIPERSASADVPGLESLAASGTATPNAITTLGVSCSSGKKALGGGFEVDTSGLVQVIASGPNGASGTGDNAGGWVIAVKSVGTSASNIHVWVVCATIGA